MPLTIIRDCRDRYGESRRDGSAPIRRGRARGVAVQVIHWLRRPRYDRTPVSSCTIYGSLEGYMVIHNRPFCRTEPERFYAMRDATDVISVHRCLDGARRACERDCRARAISSSAE